MPNKKRWEYGLQYTTATQVEVFGTGPAGKRHAKQNMVKGDRLVRRFVGRWKDAH